jgi:hypothetical protein
MAQRSIINKAEAKEGNEANTETKDKATQLLSLRKHKK